MVTPPRFRRGDIVYVDFDPQAGHEQRGRRPAFVVSDESFQKYTGLIIVCPVTNRDRGYPLHIALDRSCITTGFVMCEQIRSVDPAARRAEFSEHSPESTIAAVMEIVETFLG